MPSDSTFSAFESGAGQQTAGRQDAVRFDNRRSDKENKLIRRRLAARSSEASRNESMNRWVETPADGDGWAPLQGPDLVVREHNPRVAGFAARSAKRGFDVLVALLALIAMAPLMIALAWMVRRDGSNALFGHKRLGAGGRTFQCLKFRSMVTDADRLLAEILLRDPAAAAEWAATQKLRHDPRVTPVGRFLRKTSLDELPQLLNVLRGEMSLVGPRPIVSAETRFYGNHIEDYYAVRPGITGLWQVSGRSDTTYERRVQFDVSYVKNWTFRKDLEILIRTIPVVMLRGGAV